MFNTIVDLTASIDSESIAIIDTVGIGTLHVNPHVIVDAVKAEAYRNSLIRTHAISFNDWCARMTYFDNHVSDPDWPPIGGP